MVARVAAASDEVLVVTRADDRALDALSGVRLVIDRRRDAGPLAGMEAAALEASHPIVLVVAVDMPWVAPAAACGPDRMCWIATPGLDAVAVATDRGPQPLLAAYRRDALARATRDLLDAGEHRATRILESLRVEVLPPSTWRAFDPSGRSVLNLNSPADLERSA